MYYMVEEIVEELCKELYTEDGNPVLEIFTRKGDPVKDFNFKVIKCMYKAIWLSDNMFLLLVKLNATLDEMLRQIQQNYNDNSVESIAITNHDKIRTIRQSVSKIFFEDICALDDISKYRKKEDYQD